MLVSYKEGLKFARVLHKKLGERFMEQRIITVFCLIDEYLKDEEKLKQLYLKHLNDCINYLFECKIIKKEDVIKKLLEGMGV